MKVWNWVQLILATPIVFYSGGVFFKRGWSSIRRWSLNMWTLISIGVGAAFLFSVLGLLVPELFPLQFKDEHGGVHLYFEAAAVILTLVLMGQVLELKAHSRTNSAIKALLGLVPPIARVIRNGKEEEIPLEEVQVGDILKVKPGEKIPIDGIITDGTAIIDESMITGEPIPTDKSKEDNVTGGTINGKTVFEMKAVKVGSDTLVSQIIEMVNTASRSRAPIQKLADVIAKCFVQILIIDKTGTITEGKPSLKGFRSFGKLSDNEILRLAASIDSNSEHPIAEATVQGAKTKNIELLKLDDFESVTGKGVKAIYRKQKMGLGNQRLMEDFSASLDESDRKLTEEWRITGQTVMYLILENNVEGIVSVADKIKETSAKAIKELQKMGIKVHMLTGDNKFTAKEVAGELQLDGFQADCMPDDKYKIIIELQEQGHVVAMAGDGINDAPALAQANIGIAMGMGTDIAMQSAKITLVKGDLNGIVRDRELSGKVAKY